MRCLATRRFANALATQMRDARFVWVLGGSNSSQTSVSLLVPFQCMNTVGRCVAYPPFRKCVSNGKARRPVYMGPRKVKLITNDSLVTSTLSVCE